MKPTLQPVLALRNANERDQYIQFFEKDHKYLITFEPDVKYTSVTTWNHKHFTEFNADDVISSMMKGKGWKEGHKYWGLTSDQIKAQWNANGSSVSSAGTDMHFEIECFMNEKLLPAGYTHEQLYNLYMNIYR